MAERIRLARIGFAAWMEQWKREGVSPSAFSPLAGSRLATRAAAPGLPAASPVPADAAAQDVLKTVQPAITDPSMTFVLRTGGGAAPMQEQVVCLRDGAKPAGLLLSGADAVLCLYEDENTVFDGFIGPNASRSREAVPNLIPPLTDPEVFLCLLHVIDMYRRSLYASLLACRPQTEPGVSLEAFGRDMARVLAAKDVRWLLGAFVALMPNLPLAGERPDAVRALVEAGLCRLMKDKAGKPWLTYTDEGRALGVEFERTWLMGCGYALHAKVAGQDVTVGTGFVAPTALTNHTVTLVADQGRLRINHQAFYDDQLKALWAETVANGWKQVRSGVAQPAPAASPRMRPMPQEAAAPQGASASPVPAPETGKAFCMYCGQPLLQSDRFCNTCGKPVA